MQIIINISSTTTAIGDYHHGAPPNADPMRTGNIKLQQQYPY
jgi:hypothetical protein